MWSRRRIEEGEVEKKMADLPKEMIDLILIRLPVKSLLRFRCVCKPWDTRITDPVFARMHLKHQDESKQTKLILQHYSQYSLHSINHHTMDENEKIYWDVDDEVQLPSHEIEKSAEIVPIWEIGDEERVVILGSCHGFILVCVYNVTDVFNNYRTFCIWNPTTRKYRKLVQEKRSQGRDRTSLFGFGYDFTTDAYKLLCLESYRIRVYSTRTNSWRQKGNIKYGAFCQDQMILANANLHWLVYRTSDVLEEGVSIITFDKHIHTYILSFDLRDEELREVPQPNYGHDGKEVLVHVTNLEGSLCVVSNFRKTRLSYVWLMKDYGVKDSWTKVFCINRELIGERLCGVRPLQFLENGQVLLHVGTGIIVLYDSANNRARHLSSEMELFVPVRYVESLISPNVAAPNVVEVQKKQVKRRKYRSRVKRL